MPIEIEELDENLLISVSSDDDLEIIASDVEIKEIFSEITHFEFFQDEEHFLSLKPKDLSKTAIQNIKEFAHKN